MVRNSLRPVVSVPRKARAYDFGVGSFRALVLRLSSHCVRRFVNRRRKKKQTRIFSVVRRNCLKRNLYGVYVRNEKPAARRPASRACRNNHRQTFLFGRLPVPRRNRVLVRLSLSGAVWVCDAELAAKGS